ncbi:unnamed protein product, partial [Urochloa humidicola]
WIPTPKILQTPQLKTPQTSTLRVVTRSHLLHPNPSFTFHHLICCTTSILLLSQYSSHHMVTLLMVTLLQDFKAFNTKEVGCNLLHQDIKVFIHKKASFRHQQCSLELQPTGHHLFCSLAYHLELQPTLLPMDLGLALDALQDNMKKSQLTLMNQAVAVKKNQ